MSLFLIPEKNAKLTSYGISQNERNLIFIQNDTEALFGRKDKFIRAYPIKIYSMISYSESRECHRRKQICFGNKKWMPINFLCNLNTSSAVTDCFYFVTFVIPRYYSYCMLSCLNRMYNTKLSYTILIKKYF